MDCLRKGFKRNVRVFGINQTYGENPRGKPDADLLKLNVFVAVSLDNCLAKILLAIDAFGWETNSLTLAYSLFGVVEDNAHSIRFSIM